MSKKIECDRCGTQRNVDHAGNEGWARLSVKQPKKGGVFEQDWDLCYRCFVMARQYLDTREGT